MIEGLEGEGGVVFLGEGEAVLGEEDGVGGVVGGWDGEVVELVEDEVEGERELDEIL